MAQAVMPIVNSADRERLAGWRTVNYEEVVCCGRVVSN